MVRYIIALALLVGLGVAAVKYFTDKETAKGPTQVDITVDDPFNGPAAPPLRH